jgi:aminoglycoside phosphotransferase (APT) family kinase protein
VTDDRWERLGGWLAPRLGASGPVEVTEVAAPASTGYSAETVMFTCAYDAGEGRRRRRLVLRAETPDPAIYPSQAPGLDVEIEIQRRVMEGVRKVSTVPLAPILGGEPDPEVIGTPFFVMEFVAGDVPAVDPAYTAAGFFAAASAEQRTRLVADGLAVLARVHAVDWRAAGLEWLVPTGALPTMARQVDLWEAFTDRELDGRRHPLLERAFGMLHRHLGPGSAPSLCWGDPRPGNMIWQDFRCVCVTDWEAAAIAPPELDLGWWLMFDRTCHEGAGVARLAGEPTREEQRELYASAAGRDVKDTGLAEVFAATRYAAIVVRVMNRAVARGHMPTDHGVWLDNPATVALGQLLED